MIEVNDQTVVQHLIIFTSFLFRTQIVRFTKKIRTSVLQSHNYFWSSPPRNCFPIGIRKRNLNISSQLSWPLGLLIIRNRLETTVQVFSSKHFITNICFCNELRWMSISPHTMSVVQGFTYWTCLVAWEITKWSISLFSNKSISLTLVQLYHVC